MACNVIFSKNTLYITLYTAILRKIVEKNWHVTIPKGNMGYIYVQYTAVPDTVTVEPTFFAFLWHLRTWPLLPFFQISFSCIQKVTPRCEDIKRLR